MWEGFYLDPWVYFAPRINYEGAIVGWQLVQITFEKKMRSLIDRDTDNEES